MGGKIRITFVAMGAENVSLEYLSAVLKEKGHEVSLAFDRALFDDKAYFPIPFLAKLFNYREKVVEEIIESNPDLIGFSVFVDNYLWALEIAGKVKKHLNVPIVFGGIHPTTVPEKVIQRDEVDIICLGEGEYPFLELVETMANGRIDYHIKNLWFKNNGNIIRNPIRPLIENLDELPMPDKALFEKVIPIKDYYLTVTSRGCISACAYCSQNFLRKWEKGKGRPLREKSVDNVIKELKVMKGRYRFKRVDIKNNILSGSKKWIFEFAEKYKKEIGVPFRIMGHPRIITYETMKVLKDAGLWHVQMGVESLNPNIRKKLLGRHESNEQIFKALKAMDDAGVRYSVDLMVGLPGECEQDLISALKTFSRCRNLIRASIFWLVYLPGVDITHTARERGFLTESDLENIEEGGQENYLSTGSVKPGERMVNLKNYHLLFRILPITPRQVINVILRYNLHRVFRFMPQKLILIIVDITVSFLVKDHYALFAMKSYLWEIKRRITKRFCIFSNWI